MGSLLRLTIARKKEKDECQTKSTITILKNQKKEFKWLLFNDHNPQLLLHCAPVLDPQPPPERVKLQKLNLSGSRGLASHVPQESVVSTDDMDVPNEVALAPINIPKNKAKTIIKDLKEFPIEFVV